MPWVEIIEQAQKSPQGQTGGATNFWTIFLINSLYRVLDITGHWYIDGRWFLDIGGFVWILDIGACRVYQYTEDNATR